VTPSPFNPVVSTLKPLRRRKENMKTVDTILALLSWIVLALVLWAVMPLLLKLVALANGVNHLFGL
jgi:hypothetical protein